MLYTPIAVVLCSVMEVEAVGAFSSVCSSPEDSLEGLLHGDPAEILGHTGTTETLRGEN